MFRLIPPITLALVAACLLWTGLAWALEWGPSEAGALRTAELWDGEYWRLLTATFLHHTGLWGLHIGLNCLSLLFVGRVVEKACGGRVYLITLAGGALAGFTSSMVGAEPVGDYWRMGISGGILGLVGLVLAIEWAITRTFNQFISQRNTILIIVLLAVSVALGEWIGSNNVKVDHAAHAGGFLFGLLAGLAYYGRSGLPPDGTMGPFSRPKRRPLLGAAAVVVLGILPILYISHPVLNSSFHVWRGDRAYNAGELEEAAKHYERAWALDAEAAPGRLAAVHLRRGNLAAEAGNPEEAAECYEQALEIVPRHPVALARLAVLRDDPASLEGIEPPEGQRESLTLHRAYLILAGRRFESDPAASRALAERATELRTQSPEVWFSFAEEAQKANLFDVAYSGFQHSAEWLLLTGQGSEEWRPRARALPMLVQSEAWSDPGLPVLLEAARTTHGAAGGLASEMAPESRAKYEDLLGNVAIAIGKAAYALESDDAVQVRELHHRLAKLFMRLAENTENTALRPRFRYGTAYWYWREVGEEDPEQFTWVKARFNAALQEARELGDATTQKAVEQWFKGKGLEVPPPDLDEDEAGG